MQNTAARYKAAGVDIDADGVIQEAVADYSGAILEGGEVLDRFIADNKSDVGMLNMLIDAIKEVADTLAGTQKENAQAAEAKLESAVNDVNLEKENTAQTDGERYSIKKTSTMGYREQLNLIESGKINGSNSLYIGTPYAGNKNSVFSAAPFAMNQSDYRKSRRESGNNKNYSSHGVPFEFFVNMPQYLRDAPMFIDNGNKATVITSYPQNDKNGNPSYEIAGVWKNQPMENNTVNLVKSIYPYDDLTIRIKNAAENGTLVIANKNKAAEMLTTIGVQPAEVSNILNLAKDSVPQPVPTVKEQFSIKMDSSLNGIAFVYKQ